MKISNFFFTILLLLSLSLFTGCIKKPAEEKEPASQQTPKQEQQTNIPEGWKKFENKTHKFSFYYPQEFEIKPEIEKEDLLTFALVLEDKSQEQKTFWDGKKGYPYYSIAVRVENNPDNLSVLDWETRQVIPRSRQEAKQSPNQIILSNIWPGVKTPRPRRVGASSSEAVLVRL